VVEISGEDVPRLKELLASPVPRPASELARLLMTSSCPESEAVEALRDLVAASVLVEVAPATGRVEARGAAEFLAAVQKALEGVYWPAAGGPAMVELLGLLGTPAWHNVARAQEPVTRLTLSCSLEADGSAWVVPLWPRQPQPCPVCLGARRTAVDGPATGELLIASLPSLQAVAWHAVRFGAQAAAGAVEPGQVLHIRGATAVMRTLIPFSQCGRCGIRPLERTLEVQAKDAVVAYQSALEARETPELSDATRDALLDPVLGPFYLRAFDGVDAFRDLPLVIGGLRTLQAHGAEFRRRVIDTSFGAGLTERRARLVCLVETIERYAALMERPDVRNRTAAELKAHAAHPATIITYTDEQHASSDFPFQKYDGGPLDWAWTCEMVSGRPTLVPFDALSSSGWLDGACAARKPLMNEPTSHGTAVHRSLPRALLRSLFEWIERDAFLLAWYLQLPLRQLTVTSGDRDSEAVRQYLAERGIRLRFFDMAVDFQIPTVLCVAEATETRGRWPAGGHLVSSCSAPTWGAAVAHTAREILGHYLAFACVEDGQDPDGSDPEAGEYFKLLREYLKPENGGAFAFLGPEVADPDPKAECASAGVYAQLGWLRRHFQTRNMPVYARMLAQKDAVRSGLVVARTLVPGLLRMAARRELVNFGEPRVDVIRKQWGVTAPLNPHIHPVT